MSLRGKLLVPLVSTYRYEGAEVDMTVANSEANILQEKISEKAYNHDELIRILTTRSKAQLNATFKVYNDQFGHPINKVLLARFLIIFAKIYAPAVFIHTPK